MVNFTNIFGKKKDVKVDESISDSDNVSYKQDPVTGEEIVSDSVQNTSSDSEKIDPSVLVIVLKSRLEELEKQKKDFNDSFLKMNQIIGELRGKVLEQEKTIQRMQSKVLRAEDMVNILDPLNINKQFEEEKMKIEAASSKVDSFISIAESVKSEITSAKSKIIALGGEAELKKFNKDVQELLKKNLESQSRFSAKLEKSQTMFNEMQKNYSYSMKYFTILEAIESSVSRIHIEQSKIENSLKKFISNDVYQKNISEINTYIKNIEQKYKELLLVSGIRESSLSEKNLNISDSLKNIEQTREVDLVINDIEKKNKMTSKIVSDSSKTVILEKNKRNIETNENNNSENPVFMRSY